MITPPPGFRGIFRQDEIARSLYSEAAGIGRILPSAIAVPRDAEDVLALVKWAAAQGVSLTPRGSGSSMGGGATGHGVIVDLSRMNSIRGIDVQQRSVWVEPGAVCGELNAHAAKVGLRFPVDPSSSAFCTLGGMVGTNASGPRSLKFGPTRAWVKSLDCVFNDGTRAVLVRDGPAPSSIPALARLAAAFETQRPEAADKTVHAGVRKDSSGYRLREYLDHGDLMGLIVGSEGTLVLVVGIELLLLPLPVATASVIAAFGSLDDCARAASSARDAGASACELFDRTFLAYAASSQDTGALLGDVSGEVAAVLIAETEGGDAGEAKSRAGEIAALFQKAGAVSTRVASGTDEESAIWKLRHAASPILAALPHSTSMQFIEDGAVPPDRLADYIRGVREALARHRISGVIFGHAGDANVHVNPLVDVRRDGWRSEINLLLGEVAALTASLGGTLTGEHGDGRLRAPLLPKMWDEEARLAFVAVKTAFDPQGIFNPGVKLALPGQQPFEDIKYDPALSPLDAGVRRALDEMVERRAYDAFRLSLVSGTK